MSDLSMNRSVELKGIHKFTGTLTFEFYGEPGLSTTDVFRYQLEADFKEDASFMLEGIKWSSHPIDVLTWQKGKYVNGEFVAESQDEAQS